MKKHNSVVYVSLPKRNFYIQFVGDARAWKQECIICLEFADDVDGNCPSIIASSEHNIIRSSYMHIESWQANRMIY